jgi:transketolase
MIGYGAPTKAGTSGAHGSPLGRRRDRGRAREARLAARPVRNPGRHSRRLAQDRARAAPAARGLGSARRGAKTAPSSSAAMQRRTAGSGPLRLAIQALKARRREAFVATRKASGKALEVIKPMPELVGGSADLTGSNNTANQGRRFHAGQLRRPLHHITASASTAWRRR